MKPEDMMERSPRDQLRLVLSVAFALAPFAFGLLRYVETGSDLRMLWMALASAVGAMIVRAFVRARGAQSGNTLPAIATLVIATAFATAMGMMLGATMGPGVFMVALVQGTCWMMSFLLIRWSQPV